MRYIPTIGLEIHAELKTQTKMFCGCKNDPDEKMPNVNICPVCCAHPGTLPVINRRAVEEVLKVGIALKSEHPKVSKFDRKNYFYPDLPKGYQISQYDLPLCEGGYLEINDKEGNVKKIRIRRVHLEEDTGRLLHANSQNASLVDYNRAGVPLMELVTEPDIADGEEAVTFAKKLQLILRYMGAGEANMEKGQMRIEANISISKDENLGTKVEIKNLNSFKAAQEAVNYEVARQEDILENGERVVQETRGWNEIKKQTFSQRLKEEAHDYRYFPEPDLPPMDMDIFDWQRLRVEIPELPDEKIERFEREYGLSGAQAALIADDLDLANYFENSISELRVLIKNATAQTVFNYLTSDLKGLMNATGTVFGELKISPAVFAQLIFYVEQKKLTSRIAKDVLRVMFEQGTSAEDIIKEKGLDAVVGEDEIIEVAEAVISANAKAVADYKKGQQNALQFLVGQAMGRLKGRGNPNELGEIIKKRIE